MYWVQPTAQIMSFNSIKFSASYLKYLTLHLNTKKTCSRLLVLYLLGGLQNHYYLFIYLILEFCFVLPLPAFLFFEPQNSIATGFLASYLVCWLLITNYFWKDFFEILVISYSCLIYGFSIFIDLFGIFNWNFEYFISNCFH